MEGRMVSRRCNVEAFGGAAKAMLLTQHLFDMRGSLLNARRCRMVASRSMRALLLLLLMAALANAEGLAGRAAAQQPLCPQGSTASDLEHSSWYIVDSTSRWSLDQYYLPLQSLNTCNFTSDPCCLYDVDADVHPKQRFPKLMALVISDADPKCTSDPALRACVEWAYSAHSSLLDKKVAPSYNGVTITLPLEPKGGSVSLTEAFDIFRHQFRVTINFNQSQGCEPCNNMRKLCGGSQCQVTWQLAKITKKFLKGPGAPKPIKNLACCLNGFADLNICQPQSGKYACQANADCTQLSQDSWGCRCNAGFEGDFGAECTDVDECAVGNGGCHESSKCRNTVGGYHCYCEAGLKEIVMDGVLKCTDNATAALCGTVCHEKAQCVHTSSDDGSNGTAPAGNTTAGLYQCLCLPGYTGDGVNSCNDVDECRVGIAWRCRGGAACTNTDGGYKCGCGASSRLVSSARAPELQSKQAGVDICIDGVLCGNTTCNPLARCVNSTNGTPKCICNNGFKGDGVGACKAITLCREGSGAGRCHQDAFCKQVNNVQSCVCNYGYSGDGLSNCTYADPCQTGADECAPNAACLAVPPFMNTTKCECNPGYTGDGTAECKEVDECAVGNGGCDTNAICTNTDGGQTCTCKRGYRGDGATCMDTGCTPGQNPCHENAVCLSVDGNISCACKPGYHGDGINNCTDECAVSNGGCLPQAFCQNTEGGRRCTCKAGDDGTKCRVLCWGTNYSETVFYQAEVPGNLGPVMSISAKDGDHTCAVRADGAPVCWGAFKLGGGSAGGVSTGSGGAALRARSISADMVRTLLLTESGAVKCYPTIFDYDNNACDMPPELRLDGAAAAVAAGEDHACAITAASAVRCWGGRDVDSHQPPAILQRDGAVESISAARGYTCAVDSQGELHCWGVLVHAFGIDRPSVFNYTPPDLGRVSAVFAGEAGTCAVTVPSGALRCWGLYPEYPALWNGTLAGVRSVAWQSRYPFVLTEDGKLRGYFFVDTKDAAPPFAEVPGDLANATVTGVEAGINHVCVIVDGL